MTENDPCYYHLAKQFSRYPGGRLKKHGPYSGEEFRDDILIPIFESCNKLTVDLTGTVGFGASFLDESFGELGKIYGLQEVKEKLILIADDDPMILDTIWRKIEIAANENKQNRG